MVTACRVRGAFDERESERDSVNLLLENGNDSDQ